jgi:4-hydroxy-4-methyl-2-oxoglutarate aldolase
MLDIAPRLRDDAHAIPERRPPMTLRRNDPGFLRAVRDRLYTAVLSDVLDEAGCRGQALPARIRPLDDALVMAGFARTGLYREAYHVEPGENPYELEIALVDDLAADDIVVFACGGSRRIAPWGELLSTAATARGAVGCLTDGFVRDVKAIRAMRFPAFHGGIAPLDSKGRGKVAAIDVPVDCAGVRVEPGDLVFGDADGVVVVPRGVEERVIARAFEKVSGEDQTRDELRAGAKLRDVFARHGIL